MTTKQLESIDAEKRTDLQKALLNWQTDPDLAGIRDAAAVSNLPALEQNVLNQLWNDVAAIQKKLEGLPE